MDDILSLQPNHPALKGLPKDIAGLCTAVQGLLIHDSSSQTLYGAPPVDLRIDRTTEPVLRRIEAALARHPLPLASPRPLFERQVGTCRDFAAMLCAFARATGLAARVRCGFARYLGGTTLQDHWVAEYRQISGSSWALADAQLDDQHRQHLGVGFDIADVPRSEFITADGAWRQWRGGRLAAHDFVHGPHHGERLLVINLVRDTLARSDILVSIWDRWRDLVDLSGSLDRTLMGLADDLASGDMSAIERILEVPPFDRLGRVQPCSEVRPAGPPDST